MIVLLGDNWHRLAATEDDDDDDDDDDDEICYTRTQYKANATRAPRPVESVPTHLVVAATQLCTDRVRKRSPEVPGATE